MKYLGLFALFFAFALSASSQSKITFLDQKTSKTIYYVQVFSLSNELLSISDINGQIILNDVNRDELIAKHLDYKPIKFRPKLNDTIFLQSLTQELGEVTVKPINKRNLLRAIVENSKQKMPHENFYGKLNVKGFYAHIMTDSSSNNLREKWDTSIYFVDFDVNFQYLFSKNLNNCKLLLAPSSAKFDYMSNKKEKVREQFALEIFTFFTDQNFSFYNDLFTDILYLNFLKRKNKTSKVGVDLIKSERNNSKKQFEAFINYHPDDTSLISYKSLSKKFTNNSIRYEHKRAIDYGLDSNAQYFLVASKWSHYALILCDEVDYRYHDINRGTNPAITDSISLSNFLKNVSPTIIPYKTGVLPKRYYELFKGKTMYDFQSNRKKELEEMKEPTNENEEDD